MVNLIQPITVQQAYDGITHTRRWASWNWWWRMVDDDDGDGFPSPEPRTDSRSALTREIRAWQRLRIVKRDESFSLVFLPESKYMESRLRSVERQGAHEAGGAPPPSWTGVGPLVLILSPVFFIISIKNHRKFSAHSENFYFSTKNDTPIVLLKTTSIRVSSNKSYQNHI